MALTTIDDRGLKTPIDLLDNEQIRFGTGNDLAIYHDGSNSHIHQDGTGDLQIRSDNSIEFNTNGTENAIWCDTNGAVKLYYDTSLKFKTTSAGVDITGTGTNTVEINGTGDHELYSYHDASGAGWATGLGGSFGELVYLNEANSNVVIYTAGETSAKFLGNGAVELYYDNSKKLETYADGIKISGGEGEEANLTFFADEGDNASDKYRLRTADSGGFFIENYMNGSSWETNIKSTGNGAVELYHDNVKTFETIQGGVNVLAGEGQSCYLYMSSDEGDDNGDKWQLKIDNGDQAFMLKNYASGSWEKSIECNGDGNVELYYDNSLKLATFSGGISVTGNVNADGFHVGDTEKYVCGDGNDLEIKHASGDNYIWGTTNCAIAIGTNATSRWVFNHTGELRPSADSTYDLGTDSNRVRKVYADSVVQTADTGFKYVVSTQGDTNIPHNTYTTIQSDYGWVLPEAGTYLLSSSMRVRQWGVTGLIQCRLYDTTNSSVLSSPDSTRMMWEDQNGQTRNVQITLTWVHTCSGAVTINQQFNTSNNSNNTSIQNDVNGRNYAYWQRIG